MTYFEVGFLKRNSDICFTSNKTYVYKTKGTVYEGTILNSFKRVDNDYQYNSRAMVINILSEAMANSKAAANGVSICEVEILSAKHPENVAVEKIIGTNYYSPIDDVTYLNQEKRKSKGDNCMNFKSMFNSMNFSFGRVDSDDIAYSIKGMAVGSKSNDGSYKTYVNGEIVDVTGFVIKDMPLFKMPVAIKDISVGDMVIHQDNPVIVTEIHSNGTLSVVNVEAATEVIIYPVKNIFNFNYYTKIMNPYNSMVQGASEDNPFGSIPMWMMFLNDEDSDGSADNSKMDMLAMAMMMNGQSCGNMGFMLPMLMVSDNNSGNSNKNMAMMAMMMMANQANQMSPNENSTTCAHNCKCAEKENKE